MVTKLRIVVALLVVSLVGVSGVGLCCASMARVEAEPHGCCPPEAGFSEARVSCCESPSEARAVLSDVTVTPPHATLAGPAGSSPFAAAPGATPLLRVVVSSAASPPASSPILRI
jgi:hypothetical protein